MPNSYLISIWNYHVSFRLRFLMCNSTIPTFNLRIGLILIKFGKILVANKHVSRKKPFIS